MKRTIERLNILLYAARKKLQLSVSTERKRNSKNICILFAGALGDAVLFWDTLQHYSEVYPREAGYKIVIACSKRAYALFEYADRRHQFDYISTIDVDAVVYSYSSFKTAVAALSGCNYHTLISVPSLVPIADLLAFCLRAEEKITIQIEGIVRKLWHALLRRITYSRIINCKTKMFLDIYAELLSAIQGKTHCSQLPYFPPQQSTVELPRKPYVVVSSQTGGSGRSWPEDRFATVIDYISIHFADVSICFVGSLSEKEAINNLLERLTSSNTAILNYAGRTEITDLFELIRGAVFLIGNDSAAVHIAAAVRTPSIAIAGWWNPGLFLPYSCMTSLQQEPIPKIVQISKPCCSNCAMIFQKRRLEQYKDCFQSQRQGLPRKCINEITADGVISAIMELLRRLP